MKRTNRLLLQTLICAVAFSPYLAVAQTTCLQAGTCVAECAVGDHWKFHSNVSTFTAGQSNPQKYTTVKVSCDLQENPACRLSKRAVGGDKVYACFKGDCAYYTGNNFNFGREACATMYQRHYNLHPMNGQSTADMIGEGLLIAIPAYTLAEEMIVDAAAGGG